jgi:hypothetical protein
MCLAFFLHAATKGGINVCGSAQAKASEFSRGEAE